VNERPITKRSLPGKAGSRRHSFLVVRGYVVCGLIQQHVAARHFFVSLSLSHSDRIEVVRSGFV
ncbi:MAG: hypothetical protein ACOX87_12715, partial [Chloroflexota bacterium]